MKTHIKSVRALARIALILGASPSVSHGVQVAIPAVADLQVTENEDELGNVTDGAAPFDSDNLNARYSNALSHEVIALRFDMTGRNRMQATNAWLKLVNFRQQTTGQVLYFHGVADGATGFHEINGQAGPYTDDNWPENGTVFSTTPGLNYDADPNTEGFLGSAMFLGSVGIDNGNRDEGMEVIFSSPELHDFLLNHPDDVVTILVSSFTINTGQKRFASKEATGLLGTVDPVAAGTFSPKLVLDLPGESVKAVADAEVREVIGSDSGPTFDGGNGTGPTLNARYVTAANGERNEVIALQFDLTGVAAGEITSADLRLVNHRTNASLHRLRFFGVDDGATGYNAVTGEPGPYTDNNWLEAGIVFSAMPGLELDNDISTGGVRMNHVTDLGSISPSPGNGNNAEGSELIFTTATLLDFLNNHPDRIVTILITTEVASTGQKRFASRETVLLDGEIADPDNPFPPGTFAPSLNLMVSAVERFAIQDITLGAGTGQITLTWESEPGQMFRIHHSQNLMDNFPGVSAANIPAAAEGMTTTHTFANPLPAAPRLFFRVERP